MMVFPEPVAILLHQPFKRPPSPSMSIPSDAVPSVSQIRVSMASNWQKKTGGLPVLPVHPMNQQPLRAMQLHKILASRQAFTLGRMMLTRSGSTQESQDHHEFLIPVSQ